MRYLFPILFVCTVLLFGKLSYADDFVYQTQINAFYEKRGGEPLWIDGKSLNEDGTILLSTLENAWSHGLNPSHYNLLQMNEILSYEGFLSQKENRAVELEVLLTQAYIKYRRDLSGMRVNPKSLSLRSTDWKTRMSPADALATLDDMKGEDALAFMHEQEPKGQTYKRLRVELTRVVGETGEFDSATRDHAITIMLNLERLRWIPDITAKRFIIVNIPSATLWAIDTGQIEYEMPVIVGRVDRPTQVFIDTIDGVRLNPTWTIPHTIKKEDILPQLKRDPSILSMKGIELYDGYGKEAQTLDPTSIDWNNLTDRQLRAKRMVQGPGRLNPLGDVRVLMANEFDIYLHDTNEHHDFKSLDRALSSGCIRLDKPYKIADFIMRYRSGWKESDTNNIVATGETQNLYTQEKMPVLILYYTAWVGDKGGVTYGKDIYGHDKKMLQEIEKLDLFPLLGDNNLSIVKVVD